MNRLFGLMGSLVLLLGCSSTLTLDDIPVADEKPSGAKLVVGDEASASAVSNYKYTHFARKDKVRKKNGWVYGNWEPSFAGACTSPFVRQIAAGAIIELKDVGQCPDRRHRVIRARHN